MKTQREEIIEIGRTWGVHSSHSEWTNEEALDSFADDILKVVAKTRNETPPNMGAHQPTTDNTTNTLMGAEKFLGQANGQPDHHKQALPIRDVSEAKRKLPHPHVIWRKAAEENAIDFEIWFNKVSGNSR